MRTLKRAGTIGRQTPVIVVLNDGAVCGGAVASALSECPGLRTLVAFSPAEALTLLSAVTVDLIVLGHPSGNTSAIEWLERAAFLGKRPPNLVLSTEPKAPDLVAAQQRGTINCIISSPPNNDDLLLAIDILLGFGRS